MKTYFANIYGDTIENVVFHSVPYSLVRSGEEDLALSQGWMKMSYPPNKKIAGNYKNIWLQLRLVRIDLGKFRWKSDDKKHFNKIKKDFSYEIRSQNSLTQDETFALQGLFFKYIHYKKYAPNAGVDVVNAYQEELQRNVLDSNSNRRIVLYYYRSKLVAFASIEIYKNSVMGLQFAWDYKDPELYLGLLQNNILANLYKKEGKKHLYLGMSYGAECIYKKRYYGFEFWTGRNWSSSKTQYDRACRTDSTIKSFADLEKFEDTFFYE